MIPNTYRSSVGPHSTARLRLKRKTDYTTIKVINIRLLTILHHEQHQVHDTTDDPRLARHDSKTLDLAESRSHPHTDRTRPHAADRTATMTGAVRASSLADYDLHAARCLSESL